MEKTSTDQRSKRRSFPLPKAAPWLVIPYGKGEKFQAFHNISEPDDTNCRKFIPELKGKSAYQKNSHQGWLIILCDDDEFDYTPWNYGDCFLLNSLTMESIGLPSFLYWYTLDGYCFCDCVLSSPPKSRTSTCDDGDGNSMVFMLFRRKNEKGKAILVFCHPGDRKWRTYMIADVYGDDIYELRSMCFFKGYLYIMCIGKGHLKIDIQHGSEPKILSVTNFLVSNNIKYESVGGILDGQCITYYVESFDEIFMIDKIFITRGVYQYCVTSMMVAKLDFSSSSWVEVTSLDDHVLFISNHTKLCCSAKELCFTRGCVYFTQPDEMSFYKYDLEDKTVSLSLPCPDIQKPWFSPNWLMIPATICRKIDERRRGTESLSSNSSDEGKAIENSSLAISLIRTRTSICNDTEKEDIKEARPLDILNDDIMWSTSSCLSPLDYIHLRAVCRNYRSVFPLGDWRRLCATRSLNLSPWLVFAKETESVYSFINPMHNDENYLTSIPEQLKGSIIRFSKGGWLLMSKGYCGVFFYNPFTKAIIRLPDLPDGCNYTFRGISFSSLPTSSDCVVFGISNFVSDSVCISFIKRGDNMWTYENQYDNVYLLPNRTNMEFEPSLNGPIFFNGSFYCLDVNGTLGVFTLENDGRKWEVLSMVPPPNCDFIYKSYLVELEGKLLSVLLGHYGKWVRIFRLDVSEMVWVEVGHLGRHVLFISNTSCIAAVAQTSRMENKIYFPRLQSEGILFYSLDSGKYHSLESEYSSTDYCNSKDNVRCSWIEPNWSETTLPNTDWS